MFREKIVRFDQYCSKCQHKENAEDEDPCDKCLGHSAREDSHKPLYFKEVEEK